MWIENTRVTHFGQAMAGEWNYLEILDGLKIHRSVCI